MADFSLAGKKALVTGASRGLGRHFAQVLAEAGADVALAARDRASLDRAASELSKTGRRVAAVTADVTKSDSVRQAFEAAENSLGGIDILVNNAGIAVSKPVLEHSEEDWDRVLDTDLKGAWLMTREAASRMIARKSGGRIVNIASLVGYRTARNVPGYATAKAGLIHLTRILAVEFARSGITVNAIAPGYFETDLNRDYLASAAGKTMASRIPMGRTGNLPELDGALLLLASPAGAYITGAIIPVDGGHGVGPA